MALVRGDYFNRFPALAAGAAPLANPHVVNGAVGIGRYLGNSIRQFYDDWRNNQDPYDNNGRDRPRKKAKVMEENEDVKPQAMETGEMRTTGGSDSAAGYRGTFKGNTQTIQSYEKYFHERQVGHSKKLKTLGMTWGMSIYGPRDRLGNPRLVLAKYGTSGAGGKAPPGIVYIASTNIFKAPGVNAFMPFGQDKLQLALSENIYANAINFYLSDFLDNKLFSDDGKRGLFLNFNKFRLKSFTIELTPITRNVNLIQYAQNVMHSARQTNGWEGNINEAERNEFKNYKHPWFEEKEKPGYFVFRDIYNSYADGTGIIPVIPSTALPDITSDSTYKREQFVIKNLDHNLTYLNEGEAFSFTRQIDAQGSYYFDRAGLLANLKTPIGNIVNQLEGQITDGSNIVKKMPEGFNILIAPGNCRVELIGEFNISGGTMGYFPLPAIQTDVNIKTSAKWECFDYNYLGNPADQQRMIDPLDQALFEFNVENSINIAQQNRF